MTLQQSHQADAEERIEDAARLYEAAIKAAPGQIETLIDLVMLYWQATDYGFWRSKGIDPEFVGMAGKRSDELLEQGRAIAPGSPAIRFWSKYIAWADLAKPLEREECRAMLRAHPEYLEPAMFLFATSQGAECEDEARALLDACRDKGTSRRRYVASVIEAGLKHSSRAKRNPHE